MAAKKSQNNSKKTVDGNDILYQMFKSLLEKDQEIAVEVVREMIVKTAVWFPVETYQRIPILLPWVVRDNSCRPKNFAGGKTSDQWGAPNSHGFLRDDNSLIKIVPRSLKISGPTDSPVKNFYVQSGFVASHVWREVNLEVLANKDPRLNSFIPNLVWLPKQISKLSDLEGGIVQSALKATSWNLYRDAQIESPLNVAIDDVWKFLPIPNNLNDFKFELNDLNFFSPDENFYVSRKKIIGNYITFIYNCIHQIDEQPKGITGRYLAGLPLVEKQSLIRTLAFVRDHVTFEMSPII